MFGNDAFGNGYLTVQPDHRPAALDHRRHGGRAGGDAMTLTSTVYADDQHPLGNDPTFYGYNFTRWIMRVAYSGAVDRARRGRSTRRFEILIDNTTARISGVPRSASARPTRSALRPTPFIDDPAHQRRPIANAGHELDNLTPAPGLADRVATQLPGQYLVAAVRRRSLGRQHLHPRRPLAARVQRAGDGHAVSAVTGLPTPYYGNFRYNVPNSTYGNFRYTA